jgi:3-oxoacyl-[acyl-carrier-protein] synthase III
MNVAAIIQNAEVRQVRDELKQKMKDGKRPTKAEMESMIRLLDHADTDRSNLDFIADQTNEVFEAAVREARQQIDEHVDRVGLKESPMAKLNAPEPPRLREYKSPIYCEHANEAPVVCPCDSDCYCKTSSCKKVD